MKNLMCKVFFSLFFLSIGFTASALSEGGEHEKTKEGFNSVDMIMHHIADAHEWHFWGEGENSFTLPLPVILYTNGNLDVFMSSEFDHGHAVVKKENRSYSIDSHGHIHEESGLSFIDFSLSKSNKLSSHGTKFPIISISAVSAKTAITQSLPSQYQPSPN